MNKISICLISFIFLIFMSICLFFLGVYFIIFDLIYFIEWELISLQSTNILMTFLLDWMSLLFLSFVLFISSLVIFYSKSYMKEEIFLNRFILLVILFIFSMMMLIISPNLISILLGWDGLGLISYCLVIYYQNVKSYNAGMLTALSNRIGDVAILIAIAWMLNYGSWNFIFYIEFMKNDFSMKIIALLVILAAMTKSAQIPFSSWLPAAMAAPTPVSALVHSSTLVTAGVYLLIRFNMLFIDTLFSQILLLMGGLTMFMAGLSANFEFDLKKIIALSTLSQLGLMMSILAMGFPKLAFFHLLTHATFKALLFMCAGGVIHSMKNSQDIRNMGQLMNSQPFSMMGLNIANLALCGFPFLAGFYSKDLILETMMLSNMNIFSFILYMFSTGLTVCYTFRLIYYCLIIDLNESSLNCLSDEDWIMMKSMMGLMVMAILVGSSLSWVIFSSFILICLPFCLKFSIIFICLLGAGLGILLNKASLIFLNKSLSFFNFSFVNSTMWFMPLISTIGVIFYPLNFGKNIIKSFDLGWSEYFGAQKIYFLMKHLTMINQFLQFNNLKIYLMLVVFWVIFLSLLLLLV